MVIASNSLVAMIVVYSAGVKKYGVFLRRKLDNL